LIALTLFIAVVQAACRSMSLSSMDREPCLVWQDLPILRQLRKLKNPFVLIASSQ